MTFKDKFLQAEKGATLLLACFGDSVTQGAFETGVFDYQAVYHNQLRLKVELAFPGRSVSVLNAGIGGDDTKRGLARMEQDVLVHRPDLCVVCFGLNDIAAGSKEDYVAGLSTIFERLRAAGIETIFMTPNSMNTYFAPDTPARWAEFAHQTAQWVNEGKMDEYIDAARETAAAYGVTLCDAYAVWQRMRAAGQDIPLRLANRINHPTRDMHRLFADLLFQTIFGTTQPPATP